MKKAAWLSCLLFLLFGVAKNWAAEAHPDLSKIHSPELEQALKTPDLFWKFITAPETDYSNRMAAAVQGAPIFPLDWLPRLLKAQTELKKEQQLHNWGMKFHPNDSAYHSELPLDTFLKSGMPQNRDVMGHVWVVPEKAISYPLTWQEEGQAPWPWQVQQALNQLYSSCAPSDPYRLSKSPAWLDETMKFPWQTDGDATTFVRISNNSHHMKNLAVMARWRKIALDPGKPHASLEVAVDLSTAISLWENSDSPTVGQVILVDLLNSQGNEEAKKEAAYRLNEQRNGWIWHGGWNENTRRPLPVTSILSISEAALKPEHGSEWTRLYIYVSGVCRALDLRTRNRNNGLMQGDFLTGTNWNEPPLNPDNFSHMNPQSPEVKKLLARFELWFHQNESKLREEAAKETPEIVRVRNEMILLEP